jgi:hypothetical protein
MKDKRRELVFVLSKRFMRGGTKFESLREFLKKTRNPSETLAPAPGKAKIAGGNLKKASLLTTKGEGDRGGGGEGSELQCLSHLHHLT